MIVVIVKCVSCGREEEIKSGEVTKGDVPICSKCFTPMVPKKARSKNE